MDRARILSWTSIERRSLNRYALGWRDIALVAIIRTVGIFLECENPAKRIRHMIVVLTDALPFTRENTFTLKRPDIVAQFFSQVHKVDVHDHFRQGLFAIERLWHTNSWIICIFSTIIAICVVNAYL